MEVKQLRRATNPMRHHKSNPYSRYISLGTVYPYEASSLYRGLVVIVRSTRSDVAYCIYVHMESVVEVLTEQKCRN